MSLIKLTLNDSIKTQDKPTRIGIKRVMYKAYLMEIRELYEASEPHKSTPFIGEKRRRKLIICLILISLALEAYVNDFLFQAFPESFTEDERNPLKDKIKELFKNKSRDFTNITIFPNLIEMIKSRDTFVHYKPQFREETTEAETIYNNLSHKKIEEYYKATIIIMKDIAEMYAESNSEEFEWIKSYSTEIS